MNNISLTILCFLLGSVQTKAQSTILFFGNIGSNNDTVFYYFDNNKEKNYTISCDKLGKYSLSITLNRAETITFYFKGDESCSQSLDLKKIEKRNQKLKTNKVQNDLKLIRGFACVRAECDMPQEVYNKFHGKWADKNNLTLEFDCYFKREIMEGGLKLLEEGRWICNGNQVEIESVYAREVEIGTYLQVNRKLVLNSSDGQLIQGESVYNKIY